MLNICENCPLKPIYEIGQTAYTLSEEFPKNKKIIKGEITYIRISIFKNKITISYYINAKPYPETAVYPTLETLYQGELQKIKNLEIIE